MFICRIFFNMVRKNRKGEKMAHSRKAKENFTLTVIGKPRVVQDFMQAYGNEAVTTGRLFGYKCTLQTTPGGNLLLEAPRAVMAQLAAQNYVPAKTADNTNAPKVLRGLNEVYADVSCQAGGAPKGSFIAYSASKSMELLLERH
jgi:hypothetical protein